MNNTETPTTTKPTEKKHYRVVQITTWYVDAIDPKDAEELVADGMADLSGTTYKVAREYTIRQPR